VRAVYTTILVPLDRSEAAEIVFPYVAEIAGKLSPEIILTSVTETNVNVDTVFRPYLERVKERLHQKLKEYDTQKEPRIFSKIFWWESSAELVRYAEEANVFPDSDGQPGSSGSRPWILGTSLIRFFEQAEDQFFWSEHRREKLLDGRVN